MTTKTSNPAQAPQAGIGALRIALVVARENHAQVELLVRSAVQHLTAQQIDEEQIRMMWAPSVFQLPLLAKSVAESRDFDGVIVLGAVAKDKTDRYFMEVPEVYRGLMDVMMNFGIPMSVGVVGSERFADVKHACHVKGDKNPGADAARNLVALLTT